MVTHREGKLVGQFLLSFVSLLPQRYTIMITVMYLYYLNFTTILLPKISAIFSNQPNRTSSPWPIPRPNYYSSMAPCPRRHQYHGSPGNNGTDNVKHINKPSTQSQLMEYSSRGVMD